MPGAGNTLGYPLLTIILFLPLVGAAVCWLVEDLRMVKLIAMATCVIDFALAMFLLAKFETAPGGSKHWA
ncbi:MAG: hypothetical protein ACRDFX_01735, partial [Chloroflexota bacterium]